MKKSAFGRFFKYTFYTLICIFALIGVGLSSAYLAVKFHLTDDSGVIDHNDRYFRDIEDKYGAAGRDSVSVDYSEAKLYHQLSVLGKYHPTNSLYILNAYEKSRNLKEAQRMLGAVEIRMQGNPEYLTAISQFDNQEATNKQSVFEWMNIPEWKIFKDAVVKDKHLIDSAAYMTGVEPRLIVSVLVGEQIRLFNSNREAYKKWIGPLKILSVETTFSLGVTGIKPQTAQTIERNLKDSASVFYLGKKYEHLLDFQTRNISQERFNRLTSYKNHFYSYLYAALNIKQIKEQWERAGFPIDGRPEILATLFNIGFESSIPKAEPVVGGSGIMIRGQKYSFGAISYEFYYSGELFDDFPFKNVKFDWTDKNS